MIKTILISLIVAVPFDWLAVGKFAAIATKIYYRYQLTLRRALALLALVAWTDFVIINSPGEGKGVLFVGGGMILAAAYVAVVILDVWQQPEQPPPPRYADRE